MHVTEHIVLHVLLVFLFTQFCCVQVTKHVQPSDRGAPGLHAAPATHIQAHSALLAKRSAAQSYTEEEQRRGTIRRQGWSVWQPATARYATPNLVC